jgi:transcriptional accessory protein Tex/SPT6
MTCEEKSWPTNPSKIVAYPPYLRDPMAELVKIDPQSLGVGLYQHDVKDKELAAAGAVHVESSRAIA